MKRIATGRLRRIALAGAAAACLALWWAPRAHAVDDFPCGKEVSADWSPEAVQPCPLTSPTGPNNGIPVYANPVENPPGAQPPAPTGWLYGTVGKYFVCDSQFPGALFYHPSGWRNNWWAYTRSDDGHWGWTPEVYFKGGADDEPDYGLRACPPPAPPPLAPGPCEPAPAPLGARLRVMFANDRRSITVPYRRRPRVSGSLLGQDGSPFSGAGLCVGEQGAPGTPVRAVASATTNGAGRFRYQLGRGVSRRVWFVHRVGAVAVASSVVVRVRAPIALRASRRSLFNGQSVVLRGRLRASARAGLLVEMQAARGRGWLTFATTRTDRHGRFRYRYRFTRTFGVQRYRLRGRIAAQQASPFATGASRPVVVRVTG